MAEIFEDHMNFRKKTGGYGRGAPDTAEARRLAASGRRRLAAGLVRGSSNS
jgi:hypothetical protein